MQEIVYTRTDRAGEKITKNLKVVRSWADASGNQIFQLFDGAYAYKDGSPVRSLKELEDVIGSRFQRELAVAWWNSGGKDRAEQFYQELETEERKRVGDFQEIGAGPKSDMDRILYQVRPIPVDKKKTAEWSSPFSWMEKFSTRPDWWGQARTISMTEWEYRIAPETEVARAVSSKQEREISPAEL